MWFQPTLTVDAPTRAYPGMTLTFTGLISHDGVGLPGMSISVSAFKSTSTCETSRRGTFTLTINVPDGYPEGLERISLRSDSAGLFSSVYASVNVTVSRYESSLQVSSPSWALSGSRLPVTGKLSVSGIPIQGSGVELRSDAGSSSAIVKPDGQFTAEVDLPSTLFTSTYNYIVYSRTDPWIRSASATGSVLVINLFTVISLPILLGGAAYLASKKIHLTHRPVNLKPPPLIDKVRSQVQPASTTDPATRPEGLRGVFAWAVSVVCERFDGVMGRNMTIREWLASIRGRLDGPLYVLVERLSLLYERFLYRGSDESGEHESSGIYERIRDLLS
jgi:hypothetical protein